MIGIGEVWLDPDGQAQTVKSASKSLVTFDCGMEVFTDVLIDNWVKVEFEAGTVWRHKKSGVLYKIDRTEGGPLMVLYSNNKYPHACTAASFYSRMEKKHDWHW